MSRPRRAWALVLLPGLLGALTACGEDPDAFEGYCDVVVEEQAELGRVLAADDGAAGLLPGLPIFERLEEAAPDDVADDWSVVVQRLSSLADALEAAGVDPATYDPVDPPDDVTPEELEAIESGAGSVRSEALREAVQNVEQQSRDVCKTELAL
ncbi:hypothetical protein [Nocardioides dongxiaopingii]|uniref:hypothetical protein n=1 Tax=Nocardioides dongxiaopingii TaxID=2576036 RepID=UPI0010C7689E|nr:hypothetical protein [Nocardioides dongxiaopingii]